LCRMFKHVLAGVVRCTASRQVAAMPAVTLLAAQTRIVSNTMRGLSTLETSEASSTTHRASVLPKSNISSIFDHAKEAATTVKFTTEAPRAKFVDKVKHAKPMTNGKRHHIYIPRTHLWRGKYVALLDRTHVTEAYAGGPTPLWSL